MITRRSALASLAATGLLPAATARAAAARQIEWDDLIPPGIPYSEIIGEGFVDEAADIWAPVFDENGTKFNEALDGVYIRIPGYVLPLELDSRGISDFLLVPYVGACIHVPPPPPNQLVLATSDRPWNSEELWNPVWVTGTLKIELLSTDLAAVGYKLSTDRIEDFEW